MLLGAAQYLSTHRDFDGTVVFIFQPAEEGGNAGARAMMQDGLFDRFPCDAVFGIHNMPGMPVNQFGFRAGPTMASSNRWDIVIKGVGGHAAQPHASVDPIIVAADMVHALQTVISRSKNPLEQAVLSITQIHAGDAYNVIPGEAVLRGTVRTYSVETLDKIEADMRRIATTLPQVYGGTGELDFVRAYPPLVNWEQETAFAAQVAENAFGAEHVLRDMPPFMGAEDSRSSWRKCRAPICSWAMAMATIAWKAITAWVRASCTTRTTISTTRCCRWAPRTGSSWFRPTCLWKSSGWRLSCRFFTSL